MTCVAGERLRDALRVRREELWQTNPRLAERIQLNIDKATRTHVHAHGDVVAAERCLGDLIEQR